MHDFKRTNKVSGIHWLKEPIDHLKISVKIKPHDGVLSLPKFENYANVSDGVNSESFDQTDEYTFKWQEKVFSLWEMQRYSDVHHCITDTELTYHNMLNELEYEPMKVFTYVHDDYHMPLPLNNVMKESNKIIDLSSCFEKLNISKSIEKTLTKETSSTGHFFKSEENLNDGNEHCMAMHVVFDSSDYNEDSQLIFKQEAILASLYYNTTHNYMLLSPDENQLELNPYCVETGTGAQLGRHYSIELSFEEEEDGEELTVLLNKLHKKWESKHKQLVNFSMPPLGRKMYHFTIEILTAAEFEADNLYVEYTIKMPDEIQCKDPLHGRTHTARVLRSDEVEEWCFGHIVELDLEIDAATDPPPLQVFLEVISTDWWGRHRTEGYSYQAVPLAPGSHSKRLSCSRPEELDRVEASSRRFFVGGCNLIKDLDVLAKPQLQDANFMYTTTGSVNLRWHVVAHSPFNNLALASPLPTPGQSASSLLLGAEAALRHYRRARARLAAATRRDYPHRGAGDAPSGDDTR